MYSILIKFPGDYGAQNFWNYCTMYKDQIHVKILDKKYYFVVLPENILFFLIIKKKLTRSRVQLRQTLSQTDPVGGRV